MTLGRLIALLLLAEAVLGTVTAFQVGGIAIGFASLVVVLALGRLTSELWLDLIA